MSLRIPLMRCVRLLGQTQRIAAVRRPMLIQNRLPRRTFHVFPALRTEAPNPKPSETSTEAESQPPQPEPAQTASEAPVEQTKAEATQEPPQKPAEEKPSPAKPDIPPPPKREVDPKDHELAELKVPSLHRLSKLTSFCFRTNISAPSPNSVTFKLKLDET